VDIEKFVSHFSKTMGEEMERRTQNDEGDICIMNPIMGPQAVKRIYSQEDINGDLNYLNKRISEGEVTEVVKNISNSKSTSDTLFAELFKYSRMHDEEGKNNENLLLSGELCCMFNRVFYDGIGVPNSWLKAYLIPIYKGKGSDLDTDNYRGVAVCSTLYRIYAGILKNRLDDLCEKHGLRAITQCGFRKKTGTISAIFALSHAIHKRCSSISQGGSSEALHVCFVDFKKAFDSVPRRLIWKRLQELGVRGKFLEAIIDLYRDTRFQVKVNGRISTGYVVTIAGVRQGCPLSPLLFGIFIEQFQALIRKECPNIGVFVLNGEKLADGTFADDMALMADTIEELQLLMECLNRFCNKVDMEVNVKKTIGTVFSNPKTKGRNRPPLIYDSKNIEYQNSFIYLGIHFDQHRWLKDSISHTAVAASRAMWALINRIHEIGIMSLETKINLFKTLVLPVGNYGCQIWGVCFLIPSEAQTFAKNPIQKMVLDFLRIITGCGKKTCRWILLREFDMWPVQSQWAILCVRIWTKNCESMRKGTDSMETVTMDADLELFRSGNTVCWSFHFLNAMCHIGLVAEGDGAGVDIVDLRGWNIQQLSELTFSEKSVDLAYKACYEELHPELKSGTRPPENQAYVVGEKGRSLDKYMRLFHDPNLKTVKASIPDRYLRNGMRFRASGIPFKDNAFEFKSIKMRDYRQCDMCSRGIVEDEPHVVFDCPFYDDLRRDKKWSCLFLLNKKNEMHIFMSQRRQAEVYEFLYYLVQKRFPVLIV
jgi:hypothetical protein